MLLGCCAAGEVMHLLFFLQENGTSTKKDERAPSKGSPSNGVATASETKALVNGVS